MHFHGQSCIFTESLGYFEDIIKSGLEIYEYIKQNRHVQSRPYQGRTRRQGLRYFFAFSVGNNYGSSNYSNRYCLKLRNKSFWGWGRVEGGRWMEGGIGDRKVGEGGIIVFCSS